MITCCIESVVKVITCCVIFLALLAFCIYSLLNPFIPFSDFNWTTLNWTGDAVTFAVEETAT